MHFMIATCANLFNLSTWPFSMATSSVQDLLLTLSFSEDLVTEIL